MSKRKRKSISTTTRFEVFKRDSFTCQYCGRSAPDVVLELEHIEPHSKGGSDEIINLITSCWACNNGKSDRLLSDDTVVKKQRAQLEELQTRREQLEMLLRWREGNLSLSEDETTAFVQAYAKRVPGWNLNEAGQKSARDIIKRYGLARALAALDAAADRVVVLRGGKATKDSVEKVLGLAFVLAEPEDIQAMYRLRARIRRRWNYVNDGRAIGILRSLLKAGASVLDIENNVERCMTTPGTSFGWWCGEMEAWLDSLRGGG